MSEIQSLKGVFSSMMKHYRMNERLKEEEIKLLWEDIVGHYITKYTEKLSVKKGVLYVTIKSPALKSELQYAKTKLLKNLNEKMESNDIKKIHFY